MAGGKPTNDFIKGQVIAYSETLSARTVANKLKIPKSTSSDIIKNYKMCGTNVNKSRSGRPKMSTPRQDRILVRESLRNRWLTSPVLKNVWENQTGMAVYVSTVLCFAELNGRIIDILPHRDWKLYQLALQCELGLSVGDHVGRVTRGSKMATGKCYAL